MMYVVDHQKYLRLNPSKEYREMPSRSLERSFGVCNCVRNSICQQQYPSDILAMMFSS
jgi:hypothetical protein